MRRPVGIDATSALMVFSAMVRLVQIIVSPKSNWTGHGTMPAGMQAISIVLMLLEIAGVWFFWQGRYWARQFVFAMSCVQVVNLLHIGETWSRSRASGYLAVANAFLGAVLLWYLETRAARDWFVRRTAADGPETLETSPLG
jgi:hypothetical protein